MFTQIHAYFNIPLPNYQSYSRPFPLSCPSSQLKIQECTNPSRSLPLLRASMPHLSPSPPIHSALHTRSTSQMSLAPPMHPIFLLTYSPTSLLFPVSQKSFALNKPTLRHFNPQRREELSLHPPTSSS